MRDVMPARLLRRLPGAARAGTAVATALVFAATALVLAWIVVHALYLSRYAGTPRRILLAVLAIALAAGVVGVSAAVAAHAKIRRHKIATYLRPGERIVGMFDARFIEDAGTHSCTPGEAVNLTLTNQRLLVQHPHSDELWLSIEHEQVAAVSELRPLRCGPLRRCLVQNLQLHDGRDVVLRMNASTALEFLFMQGPYLKPPPRQVRAVVVAAEGPTPSKPTHPMNALMPDGRPVECVLELGEHYLRIIGEDSPPLADMYYYFHWEHMQVGEVVPAELAGVPEHWCRLRLVFHDIASVTVCGTAHAIHRVREHALRAGASPIA